MPTAKKSSAMKAAPKKAAARKPVAKKAAPKKAAARKPVAKKAAPKRSASMMAEPAMPAGEQAMYHEEHHHGEATSSTAQSHMEPH